MENTKSDNSMIATGIVVGVGLLMGGLATVAFIKRDTIKTWWDNRNKVMIKVSSDLVGTTGTSTVTAPTITERKLEDGFNLHTDQESNGAYKSGSTSDESD